jgi:hypothetical protein
VTVPREALAAALLASWSAETSTLWSPENPARGQCDVTALLVQEILGGEILKTPLPQGWHFYNRVAGERLDFTAGQFATPPAYADLPCRREEAAAGATAAQRRLLAERVRAALAIERRG